MNVLYSNIIPLSKSTLNMQFQTAGSDCLTISEDGSNVSITNLTISLFRDNFSFIHTSISLLCALQYSFAYYQHSFLPIYEATLADRIDDFWPQIGPLCPKPFLGWEWDRCEMLRKGFAERVFNENRGPKIAKNFTTKSSLNKKLYKLAEKKYRNA